MKDLVETVELDFGFEKQGPEQNTTALMQRRRSSQENLQPPRK